MQNKEDENLADNVHWSEQVYFQPQEKISEEKQFLTPYLVESICFTCLVFWQSPNWKDRTQVN